MTPPPSTIVAWDPVVRTAHWLLVAAVTGSWLTRPGGSALHEWFGYATLAVIVSRLVWGFIGPPNAKFASFVRSPSETLAYAVALSHRRERRYVGHNPLGGYMVVALLLIAASTGASSWLYTTDRYWGIEWLERLHATLADALLVLATLHVLGVLYTSLRHRENLAAAMLTGCKRPEGH